MLSFLGINDSKFEINFQIDNEVSSENYINIDSKKVSLNQKGFDTVEFYISTNLGEDLKPLSKIASGGEISRVMLAIKSVLANSEKLPLLIFDEIDTGVSGRIAQKVGQVLSELSKTHQIISITHLPQIAAFAKHHYSVEKETKGERVISKIISLDKRSAKLKFANPSKLAYNYTIGKIDRLWNEVNLSNPILVKVPYLSELKNASQVNIHPILITQKSSEVLLSVHSFSNQKAFIYLTSIENIPRVEELELSLGTNIIKLADNIKLIKSIKINFESDGREEVLNLF